MPTVMMLKDDVRLANPGALVYVVTADKGWWYEPLVHLVGVYDDIRVAVAEAEKYEANNPHAVGQTMVSELIVGYTPSEAIDLQDY